MLDALNHMLKYVMSFRYSHTTMVRMMVKLTEIWLVHRMFVSNALEA